MNIQIYTPQKASAEPVRLALREIHGDIILSVVDKEGRTVTQGNLVIINKESGCLTRCSSVNPAFGFTLNHIGQIMTTGG